MQDYQTGDEKLTVYTDVPGHGVSIINGYTSRAKSDIYEIWVRSAATDNEWVQCFANMTYNRGLEMPLMTDFQTATSTHAYQKFTAGWTHTYANIEMSENSPVEVEIRKIGSTTLDGSTVIVKSAVHPAHKIIAGSKRDENGRVYFKINNPCQIVIDINGQMDDHNAAYSSATPGGRMPDSSPVHSIAFYANPIMAKPVASPTNTILTVNPADSSPTTRLTQPDPATYNTLVFAPGIHNVGASFKLYPGKSYYIPGDAILYGNIGNKNVPATGYRCNGDSIKIFGYGTICGIQVPHYQNTTHDDTPTGTPNPQYPEWHAWLGDKSQDVGIEIEGAWDTTITGVTTIDPANFNTKFDVFSGRTNDQGLVSWVKLHSWRVNGDGFGGYSKVEDSFFRTSDDSTYVRDWRRRCTFWKDTNANIFRFVNYKSGGLEDCDIIYSRWRDPNGVGSVFEFATGAETIAQVIDLNLTLRNLRFHDKLSNPRHLFDIETLESYRGITFENISLYEPKNGKKSILKGSSLAPWYELLVFKNVTYKTSSQSQYDTGTLLTAANFNTYFETNEYVEYILFDDPRNLAINITADPAKGFVTQSPNQATHVETTLATLTATAKPGYVFTSWDGLNPDDPSTVPTANPVTIRMLDNRTITANFGLADIADPVVITTPGVGSWHVPAGVYSITIQTWGGGGAGGSAQTGQIPGGNVQVRGGGGAGGGYAGEMLPVMPGDLIESAVGAGGTRAASGFTHATYGAAGGETTVRINGTLVARAQGGPGGENVSGIVYLSGRPGIAHTTGNIGTVRFYGGNGAQANSAGTGGGGGSAGDQGNGGRAGYLDNSAYVGPIAGLAGPGGGASGAAGHNSTTDGVSAPSPGGGGSGGGSRNVSNVYEKGGNGGDGKTIVTYNTMTFTLTTQAVNGSITLHPPGGVYTSGATVNASAVPNPGYQFTGWSGGLTGATNPTNIVMAENKAITAAFTIKSAVATIRMTGAANALDIGASNLEPTWEYELEESSTLTSWSPVSLSQRSNVSEAVWTITPLPGEPRKFYRVTKRN